MARLVLPSRLELKRPEGSSNEAPFAKVSFTTFLYVSPVQIIPACDHTGTPLHFHSSTASGSACLMSMRTLASVSPRQSPSSSMRASISREGELLFCVALFFMPVSPTSPFREKYNTVSVACMEKINYAHGICRCAKLKKKFNNDDHIPP